MFTATVRPVPNPDFGERRAPAKPATFRATTLGDLSEAFARWRAATGIGGGNMPRTVVDEDGREIPFGTDKSGENHGRKKLDVFVDQVNE